MSDEAAPTSLPSTSRRRQLRRARARGNHVRAALLELRAGREDRARAALEPLADALAAELGLDAAVRLNALTALEQLLGNVSLSRLDTPSRLLFALQHALDEARHPNPYDYVDWVRTFGRRPVVRRRTLLTDVLLVRRLRSIRKRAARSRLAAATELSQLLSDPLAAREDRAREAVEWEIATAALNAGLGPRSPAEQASFEDLVAALADRVLERGDLDFGRLRDAVASHRVRLDELTLQRFLHGDELLAFDRELGDRLDGLHRRGESYLRLLQRAQSVGFGTPWGRLLSLWLVFPTLGAVVLVVFYDYVVAHLPRAAAALVSHGVEAVTRPRVDVQDAHALAIPAVAVLLALFNLSALRKGLLRSGQAVLAVFQRDSNRPHSPDASRTATWKLNSSRSWKNVGQRVEAMSQGVEEWLRFTSSDRQSVERLRALLALAWFLATYLLRFVVQVILEPTINPIKHFPVVTAAGKVAIATGIPVVSASAFASLGVPPVQAGALGGVFGILVVPGFCGFLAWELKANYRLYRATAGPYLAPIAVGSHGETMLRVLRRGFHSGTLPKLYDKLHRAERSDDPEGVYQYRMEIDELARDVSRFVDRRLLRLLDQSRAFGSARVKLGEVRLEPEQITLQLMWRDQAPLVLVYRVAGRDLQLEVRESGFVSELSERQREVLKAALLGLAAHSQAVVAGQTGVLKVRWDDWDRFWSTEAEDEPAPLEASFGTLPSLGGLVATRDAADAVP